LKRNIYCLPCQWKVCVCVGGVMKRNIYCLPCQSKVCVVCILIYFPLFFYLIEFRPYLIRVTNTDASIHKNVHNILYQLYSFSFYIIKRSSGDAH
jgi:hypothetical protein